MKDRVKYCTVTANSNTIELSPPFIPSLSLQAIGGPQVTRVFLSATLDSLSDFARAEAKREAAPAFDEASSHRQAEEAVRTIGYYMGFDASRPCADVGTGPDCIWVDPFSKEIIAFELKLDKAPTSSLSKDDIGQGHDHLQWLESNYEGYETAGLIYLSESTTVTKPSNPSSQMYIAKPRKLSDLWSDYSAVVERVRSVGALLRGGEARKWGDLPEWSTAGAFKRIADHNLKSE